jgi:hypothetical protein
MTFLFQTAIIEGCRRFSDHFEFVYTPKFTPELTPELIKKNFNIQFN